MEYSIKYKIISASVVCLSIYPAASGVDRKGDGKVIMDMMMANVINNGSEQVISIPQEMHTDYKKFFIKKIGNGYILSPEDDPWFPIRLSIGQMPDDFIEKSVRPAKKLDFSKYTRKGTIPLGMDAQEWVEELRSNDRI